MAVPASLQGCGMVVVGLLVVLVVGGFAALAVDNLAHYQTTPLLALVPSVLWLGIVALVLVVGLYEILFEVGVRQCFVDCLGEFARDHFVEAERDGERAVFRLGYTLFGICFDSFRVERAQIVAVSMGSGQASALAGRDMNDWSVLLRYRDPDIPARYFDGRRIDELYIIGPARARAVTEEWFGAFVAFLRAAGVELVPGERENEFRTPDPGPPDHAPAPAPPA
jgi:hypothetical protein